MKTKLTPTLSAWSIKKNSEKSDFDPASHGMGNKL